jgi:hypothetical protein
MLAYISRECLDSVIIHCQPAQALARVDITDEGADNAGRPFDTDAEVEVKGITDPSVDATTAYPGIVKVFEAELCGVAISKAINRWCGLANHEHHQSTDGQLSF